MKLSRHILLLSLWGSLLNGTAFPVSPDSTDAQTPLFDAQSQPVFNNLNDWLAQIRTLGSPIIASKTFATQSGNYYAAISKTGPDSVGIFLYDTRSHSLSHIGWELCDSKGNGLSFAMQNIITKDYKSVSPVGGSTDTVAYGSGERLTPNYSGVAILKITTQGGGATVKFNLK